MKIRDCETFKDDHVTQADVDVAKRAEGPVAMSGDADIARVGHVSSALRQPLPVHRGDLKWPTVNVHGMNESVVRSDLGFKRSICSISSGVI